MVKLLQCFDSYDHEYHLETKEITPVERHFWFLLAGSVLTIGGNYLVAHHKFVSIFSGDESKYYLVSVVSRGNSEIALYLNYISHFVCEISFVFYMSALVYFLRWLRQKMVNLQHEILQQYSLNEKIVALEDIFLPTKVFHINKPQYQDMGFQLVEKLQKLIRIMREINLFSGEFILMFISLTLCMGIALLHVIIISLIGMGHINSSNPEIMKRGIFALTTVFVFSALKVSILVNAGEHLKSVVTR